MYKKYYSPFEEQPIKKEYAAEVIKPEKLDPAMEDIKIEDTRITEKKKSHNGGFFGNISTEDLILLGILILLLTEEKENRDIPLILGIGFLLLIEYIDN